jgi:hypothetical protein
MALNLHRQELDLGNHWNASYVSAELRIGSSRMIGNKCRLVRAYRDRLDMFLLTQFDWI